MNPGEASRQYQCALEYERALKWSGFSAEEVTADTEAAEQAIVDAIVADEMTRLEPLSQSAGR